MDPEARAQTVEDAIEHRREIVNTHIDDYLPMGDPERLYQASRHVLLAGGKRLRPTILLVAGEALTETDPGTTDYREFPTLVEHENRIDLLAAAISVEVIQSFTLIHDDIMDDDRMRRGEPAVHVAFGSDTAILAGDTLYSKAFEIMLDTGAPAERALEAVDTLASTCTRICEGQSLDIGFEERETVTSEEYLDMIDRKTAVLYAAAASIPSVLLGADPQVTEALTEYGRSIGRAFQIQDDVLDLTTPSSVLGKQRGSDLVEGKRTLITQHAREQGVDVDGLIDANDPEAVTDREIDAAVETLEAAGSIDYARNMAADLVAEGIDELDVLPETEARTRLAQIGNYLVERSY
ncbi:geranylgeranyl diphosphate synthase [Halodesulfurarchaeum formicicum]|uniref:Geranylgeranyl diphosphate synthase n=1 Tax=Halodesulfurarchaeum formicicum TaxID=1873524 RepID=A0A1D8S3M0_9EURY|nr:polyprenyl synthetase family protein [Halodesulfurarchaeum formicicum]AOW79952.1 geranylgeranyl diphosphate synthase [Halodesulfurarchaeum formicicum]APE95245.1 geranylgeranyl diphosphate synthase, type I [Halodesulfurarchaeum formicicum]